MDDEKLIELAKNASNKAYAPYSKYNVGAALLTEDGKIFTGCNVENASYGLTICAERVAVFKAVSEGYKKFKAIAIFAKGALPYPCGACRQVLAEFDDGEMDVIISNGESIKKFKLKDLLPFSFSLSD